jgi:tetratricopeptide (TPR) repeat protein
MVIQGLDRARAAALLVAGVLVGFPAAAQSGSSPCGSLANAFGPYDYRTDRGQPLYLVESAHFTPEVEQLIRGLTGPLAQELDYTLRAFPNHHRALISVMRYGAKMKSPQPANLRYPVECYFERAIRFRADDTTVKMIYATFLFNNGRPLEADKQLEQVDKLAADNAFPHYNSGLIYFEHNQFDKAVDQAQKALALGFPRTDLRDKLKAAGKWVEPNPAAPEQAASAASPEPPASAAPQ